MSLPDPIERGDLITAAFLNGLRTSIVTLEDAVKRLEEKLAALDVVGIAPDPVYIGSEVHVFGRNFSPTSKIAIVIDNQVLVKTPDLEGTDSHLQFKLPSLLGIPPDGRSVVMRFLKDSEEVERTIYVTHKPVGLVGSISLNPGGGGLAVPKSGTPFNTMFTLAANTNEKGSYLLEGNVDRGWKVTLKAGDISGETISVDIPPNSPAVPVQATVDIPGGLDDGEVGFLTVGAVERNHPKIKDTSLLPILLGEPVGGPLTVDLRESVLPSNAEWVEPGDLSYIPVLGNSPYIRTPVTTVDPPMPAISLRFRVSGIPVSGTYVIREPKFYDFNPGVNPVAWTPKPGGSTAQVNAGEEIRFEVPIRADARTNDLSGGAKTAAMMKLTVELQGAEEPPVVGTGWFVVLAQGEDV